MDPVSTSCFVPLVSHACSFQRGLKRKALALIKKLRKAKKEATSGEKPDVVSAHGVHSAAGVQRACVTAVARGSAA